MIEFRNVHAAYDDQLPVLRDVGFTIDDGEFVAFVGTNGARKIHYHAPDEWSAQAKRRHRIAQRTPTIRTAYERDRTPKLASSSRPVGRSAATPCAKSYSSDSKRKGA